MIEKERRVADEESRIAAPQHPLRVRRHRLEIRIDPKTFEAQNPQGDMFGRENFGRGDAIGAEFDRWEATVRAEHYRDAVEALQRIGFASADDLAGELGVDR